MTRPGGTMESESRLRGMTGPPMAEAEIRRPACIEIAPDPRLTPKHARARSQRDPLPARLAPARQPRDAGLRPAGGDPPSGQRAAPKQTGPGRDRPSLIRRSVQEIRRIAVRLARARIQPAYVIACSVWRRAHKAAARQAHLKRRASADKARRRHQTRTPNRRKSHPKSEL